MNNIRLAITLLNNMRPVGPVNERDHALLTDRLISELGNDYATFLAEPIASGNGAQIDWYINANSRPQPMEEMDPQKRAALLDAFENRKTLVLDLAKRLENGPRGDKEIAKALRNAMMTPDSAWLYDVDGKPVLVGWGYVSAQNEQKEMGFKAVGIANLAASSHKMQIPEPTATINQPKVMQANVEDQPEELHKAPQKPRVDNVEHKIHYHHNGVIAKPPFNWLALILWLCCAVLALTFIWLLLSSSALNKWSSVISGSKLAISDENDQRLQQIANLKKQIASLEDVVGKKQADCSEQQAANTPPITNRNNNNPRLDNGVNSYNNNQLEQHADRDSNNDDSRNGSNNGQPNVTINIPRNGNNTSEPRVEIITIPSQLPESPQPSAILAQSGEPEQTQNLVHTERQRELDEVINRAGVKTGALQITLIWQGKSDLDLSIRCPNGTRVYFKRRSSCGARLDRDANQRPDMLSSEPVENIYWSDPEKIPTQVPIYVDYYDNHGDPRPNTPFRLRIRKTFIDPQTGEARVEDKIIDGVANGSRRRNPRQIYVITNA